jgi:epoxyqueuosine reductase
VSSFETQIKTAARQLGFEVVGITSIEPLLEDEARYLGWRDGGYAAGMDYMTRRPELLARPAGLAAWARSIVTVAVNYYADEPVFDHRGRYGRVARYAWGRDYHDVVKPRLNALAAEIERAAGKPTRSRSFVDAVPLLERAVAASAGLGFFGKNTNLLQARAGSWYFLAEILLDIELAPEPGPRPQVSCGTCSRCIDACPTNAFAGPYVLDSRRCISYLTIENKEEIPRELREGVGEWIFGCDVCQDVCPFNRFSSETTWQELRPEAGAGQRLDLAEVLSISRDEEFRARYDGTPLLRPKRRGLLRNAAVVAANIGCTRAVPSLAARVTADPEPLIRGHALWALGRLDHNLARGLAQDVLQHDSGEFVRSEALALLERA